MRSGGTNGRNLPLGMVILAALVIGLAAASAAQADTRFAAPSADPAADPTVCAQAAPCDIQTAVEDASIADGDDVVVLPGTHGLPGGDIHIQADITVGKQAGQPRPLILGGNGVLVDHAGALIRDLDINGGALKQLTVFAGVAERMYVENTAPGGAACASNPPSILRDSVCLATDPNGLGYSGSCGTASCTGQTVRIRNLTAVGTGPESAGLVFNTTGPFSGVLDARNVIASGVQADVASNVPDTISSATLNFTSSNYQSTAPSGGGTVSITPAGTGGNQTAAPQFVNLMGGNFRQLSSSPTIDAGTADGAIGLADLDGNPRSVQGLAGCPNVRPDIGAFEAPSVAALPGCDPAEPDEPATKKKKCKKAKKKKRGKAAAKRKGCKKKRKKR
jgi:hypothetical protein